MGFFRKALKLSPQHIAEIKKADEQVEAAQKELSVAKQMAKDVQRIRLENNFIHDFRKALGSGQQ